MYSVGEVYTVARATTMTSSPHNRIRRTSTIQLPLQESPLLSTLKIPHRSRTAIRKRTAKMPPTRRRAGNNTTSQSTLSFGSTARVTKPSAPTPASQKAKTLEPTASVVPEKPSDEVAEPQQVPVIPSEPSTPHVAELAVRTQAKEEAQQPLGEDDEKALKVSEKDLQQYWKREEQLRKAPRGWPRQYHKR